jgi:hypothetical protein
MRISLHIPPLISTQRENSRKHEPFNQPPDLVTGTDKTHRILTAAKEAETSKVNNTRGEKELGGKAINQMQRGFEFLRTQDRDLKRASE